MNKKLFILPLTVLAMGITSCNQSAFTLNRVQLQTKNYTEAKASFDAIKKAQEEKTTSLFKKGTLTFKKKVSAVGTFRYDEVSYHEINFGISSGYTISWSLDDEYYNLVGEKDNVHVIGDKKGNYTHYSKNITDGKEYKYFYDITEKVKDCGSFLDYVMDRIDFYTVFFIPFLYTICGGITGDNQYSDDKELIPLTEGSLVPQDLFRDDLNDQINKLAEKYKDNKNGYNIGITYGSNDASSASAALKGKVNLTDIEGTRFQQGYAEVDNFVCLTDNYVKQVEYKVKGNTINTRKVNLNIVFDLHVIEEVNKDQCNIDTINPSEYEPGDPDNL